MFSGNFCCSPSRTCHLSKHDNQAPSGRWGLLCSPLVNKGSPSQVDFTQRPYDCKQHRGKASAVCRASRWIMPSGMRRERRIKISDTLTLFYDGFPSWARVILTEPPLLPHCWITVEIHSERFFFLLFLGNHGNSSLNLMSCGVKPQGFTQSSSLIMVDTKKIPQEPRHTQNQTRSSKFPPHTNPLNS